MSEVRRFVLTDHPRRGTRRCAGRPGLTTRHLLCQRSSCRVKSVRERSKFEAMRRRKDSLRDEIPNLVFVPHSRLSVDIMQLRERKVYTARDEDDVPLQPQILDRQGQSP